MKIYYLYYCYPHEDSEFIGVFDSYELANEHKKLLEVSFAAKEEVGGSKMPAFFIDDYELNDTSRVIRTIECNSNTIEIYKNTRRL